MTSPRASVFRLLSLLGILGCHGEPDVAAGSATFELTLAPPDAQCVQITIQQGTTTLTRRISVVPSKVTVFTLTGLPTGVVRLSEQVFTIPCASVTTQPPTWASDVVTVNLEPGVPVNVSFTLRRIATGGTVTVSSDFPNSSPVITEFSGATAAPSAIAVGPDGNLWFSISTAANPRRLGRITTSGSMSEFPVSLTGSIHDLVTGPDGNLWFTESKNAIGRAVLVNGAPVTTEFTLASPLVTTAGLAAGPDGALWFGVIDSIAGGPGRIGRATTTGLISEFVLTTPESAPTGVAVGPDRNIWFTELGTGKIGRLIPASGTITEFSTPSASTKDIIAGTDGNLWFTGDQAIGRITTSGTTTLFPLPPSDQGSYPAHIVSGPDGNLWFTEFTGQKIDRMTIGGVLTEYSLPTAGGPNGIAAGPDGNIWFTESQSAGTVGRLTAPTQ